MQQLPARKDTSSNSRSPVNRGGFYQEPIRQLREFLDATNTPKPVVPKKNQMEGSRVLKSREVGKAQFSPYRTTFKMSSQSPRSKQSARQDIFKGFESSAMVQKLNTRPEGKTFQHNFNFVRKEDKLPSKLREPQSEDKLKLVSRGIMFAKAKY